MKQSQEQAKRKQEISKQQTMRDVVARRSPLPFPTHQDRTQVFFITFLDYQNTKALLLFQKA